MKHRRRKLAGAALAAHQRRMAKVHRRRAAKRARRNPVSYTPRRRRVSTTTVVTNPRRRRRRARRNPMIGGKYVNLRTGGHTGTRPKRRKAAKRPGGSTVAKRRKHRKSTRTHRKSPKRVAAGKKAARTRARRKSARSHAAKRTHRRRRVTHRRVTHRRRRRVAAPRRTHRRRRSTRRRIPRVSARRGIRVRARSAGRRYKTYQVRPRYRRGRLKRWSGRVVRNPSMAGLKSMLMSGVFMFGGLLAMRAVANAIKINVIAKNPTTFAAGTMAKVAPVLPAAGAFLLGLFAPKFVKNPKIVAGIQTGAALVLFDAVFNTWIKPSLPATAQSYLAGTGFGYYGGEYIAQRPRLPMMGAVAREAMAEYTQQPMGAYDVNEALAGHEVQAMQSGYAGGSLARTLFSV